jgi:hypothetical protein
MSAFNLNKRHAPAVEVEVRGIPDLNLRIDLAVVFGGEAELLPPTDEVGRGSGERLARDLDAGEAYISRKRGACLVRRWSSSRRA